MSIQVSNFTRLFLLNLTKFKMQGIEKIISINEIS
jgi:hypothetical protein